MVFIPAEPLSDTRPRFAREARLWSGSGSGPGWALSVGVVGTIFLFSPLPLLGVMIKFAVHLARSVLLASNQLERQRSREGKS